MDRWSNLTMKQKNQLLGIYASKGYTDLANIIKHYNSFATGGSLPDHDPNNPYHYHDTEGNKVVISPEDWEANVGKPYFREIEDAVKAEQAAYPEPEYEVNPNFVRDLRSTYQYNMGNGYQNYRNFNSALPEGYSFTNEGLIVDPQGNYYVQSGYRQSPRFTYNTDSPLQFTIYKGKPIEKNLTFYPVNMDKKLKAPLPVDRVMNVDEEYKNAISKYLNDKSDLVRVPIVSGNYIGGNLGAFRNKKEAIRETIKDFNLKYTHIDGLDVDFDKNGNPVLIMPKAAFTKYKNEQLELDKQHYIDQMNRTDLNQSFRDDYEFRLNHADEILDSYLKAYPYKPSRKEAEKEAVISIGPLEKVKTFQDGGDIKHPLYNSNNITVKHIPQKDSYWDNYNYKAAEKAGVIPDYRNHWSDKYKRDIHPTSPKAGTWQNDDKTFELSDWTMFNSPRGVNNSLFGLYEQGDGNVVPTYKGSIVLPELTVTPNGNYVRDTYDSNIINFIEPKKQTFANGGHLFQDGNWLDYIKPKIKYPEYQIPASDVDDETWLNWWYSHRDRQLGDYKDTVLSTIPKVMATPVRYKPQPKDKPYTGAMYDEENNIIEVYPLKVRDTELLHERVHALNSLVPDAHLAPSIAYDANGFIPNYYERTNQMLDKVGHNGVDPYWDNKNEIYSRLMEARRGLRLLPTQYIDKQQIDKWRTDGTLKKYSLDFYSTEQLLNLFNNVAQNNTEDLSHYAANGGPLGKITPYGQWQYPHQVTTIPSNNITMKGVNYPVLGVSDTGDTQMMYPNLDYLFNGNYVTEYPIPHKFQEGGFTGPVDPDLFVLNPQISVADNTRYVRPVDPVSIAEAKKEYEAEQMQKAMIEAQRRRPQLKADTRSTEQRQRDYNRAVLQEVKKKS